MKKILAILCGTLMLMSVTAGAKTLEFTIGSGDMYISDGAISSSALDAPAYIENGRTMVPIRVISENFGAAVEWDSAARQAIIKTADTTIILTIDSDKAYVNGAEKTLDSAAVILNGRTMVPLRFISEELGREVEYIEPTAQILITDEAPISVIGGEESRSDDYRFLMSYIFQTKVPAEEMEEAVPYMNAYNEEVLLMASKAKEAGITLTEQEKADIAAAVEGDREYIYEDALVASVVKGLMNYTYAVNYINTLEFDVSEDEIVQMYKDTYVRAKHILISTVDETTGEPLSAADKKLAREKAEYVVKRLARGDDFDAMIKEYGEDPGMENYPDGYVFTKGEMVEEFENAVFNMSLGEVSGIVETSYGYHIIKRLPLPEIDEYTKYTFTQQLNQEEYAAMLEDLMTSADIKYNMTNAEIANKLK